MNAFFVTPIRVVRWIGIFTTLFLISFQVNAANEGLQPIGQVVWVKGVLKANQPNAPERVMTRRSPVYENDTLMTAKFSTGQIVFTDKSILSLREETTLKIAAYKFGNGVDPLNDTFVASIVKGGFRTITGAIPKNHPDGYQLNTAVATIGVLGTEYSVYYTPGKDQGGMITKIEKGEITVSNGKGKVVLTKCDPNEKKRKCVEQQYSRVTSQDEAPQLLKSEPVEFSADAVISPTGASNPTPGENNTQGTPSPAFCIK